MLFNKIDVTLNTFLFGMNYMKKALIFGILLLFGISAFCEECWSERFSFDGSEITKEPLLLLPTDKLAYTSALAAGNPRSLEITAEDTEDSSIAAEVFADYSGRDLMGKVCWDYTGEAFEDLPTDATYFLTETVTSDSDMKIFARFVTILPEPASFLILALVGALFLRKRAKTLLVVLAVTSLGAFGTPPIKLVSDVRCLQNWPFDRSVTISYKLDSENADPRFEVKFYGTYDGIDTFDLSEVGTLTRDGADGFVTGAGTHKTFWTPDKGFYNVKTDSMQVKVEATDSSQPIDTYMVIDLSGGTSAEKYPVSYMTYDPPGGWPEEYKTTKLVLRLVQPGTFVMGSPTGELGRFSNETQHEVTLTKPFYIGVFEVTQKQYELITGKTPAQFMGDARPVDRVSYEMIRGSEKGSGWPANRYVDENSFMGILRSKTNKAFDLPTEAQWEYACRAGTTTALNSGKNLTDEWDDAELNKLGRYNYSQYDGKGGYETEHTTVGSYLPNAWGLYDMHGNVYEWCLDWYAVFTNDAVTDPTGPATGTKRIIRGGCWGSGGAKGCRSAMRSSDKPEEKYFIDGFRIILVL